MSTVYNVITRYSADTRQARGEVKELARDASGLGQALRASVVNVQGLLAGAFAGIGLGQLGRSIAGINSQLEQAGLGLASLFTANRVYEFNDALGAARDTIEALRQDAAAGVGGLDDYLSVYQQILGPAVQAGGLDQLREITRLAVAAGTALRGAEGASLMGFDINQALTQGVGDRTTPLVNQVLRAGGVSNAQFNAMGPEARLATLLANFQAFTPAIDAQARSWEGLSSTFEDTLRGLTVTATHPLFEAWTADLMKINGWLEAHHDELERIARLVGDHLVSAWDRGVAIVRDWRHELQAAIPVLTTLAGLQLAASGGGGALVAAGEGILSVGRRAVVPVLAPALPAGVDLAAAAAAAGLVPAAPSRSLSLSRLQVSGGIDARDLQGIEDAFAGALKGGIFSGAGGAVVGAGDALLALGAKLAPLASVAAKAAVPLALISAAISAFMADTFGAASFLKTEVMGLVQEGKVLLGSVSAIFDNGLFRTLGAGLLAAGGAVVWALKWVVKGVNAVLVPLANAMQMLGIYVERGVEFIINLIKLRSVSQAQAVYDAGIAEDLTRLKAIREKRFAFGEEDKPGDPKKPVSRNITNIAKVEIHQRVEQNASPDRVAWAWNDMLAQLNRTPRQARALPVPRR